MYDFILQTSIVLSLGVIIYLIARAVPRITESGTALPRQNTFDRFISRLPLTEIDSAFNSFLEKFLRKAKVLIMKIDNLITNWIGKVKKPSEANPPTLNGSAAEKPDLFDRKKNIT